MALPKTPVILASEDRIRMARLYEEVFTRLEEMAMITSRALKLSARAGFEVRFRPENSPVGKGVRAVEVVSGPCRSGWYDYQAGACFEVEQEDWTRCLREEGGQGSSEGETI